MNDQPLLVVPAGTSDEHLDSIAWMYVFFEGHAASLNFAFEDPVAWQTFNSRVTYWRAVQEGEA